MIESPSWHQQRLHHQICLPSARERLRPRVKVGASSLRHTPPRVETKRTPPYAAGQRCEWMAVTATASTSLSDLIITSRFNMHSLNCPRTGQDRERLRTQVEVGVTSQPTPSQGQSCVTMGREKVKEGDRVHSMRNGEKSEWMMIRHEGRRPAGFQEPGEPPLYPFRTPSRNSNSACFASSVTSPVPPKQSVCMPIERMHSGGRWSRHPCCSACRSCASTVIPIRRGPSLPP